jgi:hypothetical protein
VPAAAAVFAALAAWVSFGTIGFDSPGGSRIGLLTTDPIHIAIALAIGVAVGLLLRHRAPTGAAALLPLLLVFLPWVPGPVPAAFLIWNGPLATVLWTAAALALGAHVFWPGLRKWRVGWPASPVMRVWLLSLMLLSAGARFASPSVPEGDEPHYLIITQSLLYDGDLQIENNHRRGDYHAYFGGDLRPDAIRRGRNGALYSIHAPGVPALVLPAFAIGGYHGVVVFLLLLASAACALAWWLAWRVTGSTSAAWFGWGAVALSPLYVLESFTVYPDGPGAAVVLTGFWALLRADWDREQRNTSWKPWLFHGAALATLPWMHTRFAVLAAALAGLILIRLARGPHAAVKAIAFVSIPAVSAIAWLAFFVALYGTPDPSAPYGPQMQNAFAYLPNGLGGLFFDQGFGVLVTAPVLVAAFIGFRRTPRLAIEWAIVAVPYLLAVTTFAMWWAGWSGPSRFFVPLMLPLAIPAAATWASIRERGIRASICAALVVTCWLSAVLVAGGGGQLGYHSRNERGLTAAPWIEWAAPALDLPSAFPAFVPLPVGTPLAARQAATRNGFTVLVPWLFCLGIAFAVMRLLGSRALTGVAPLVATTALAYAIAVTAAVGISWTIGRMAPVNSATAQITLLRRLASDGVAPLDLTHFRRPTVTDVASHVQIDVPVPPRERGAPFSPTVATFPSMPAGDYLITARRTGGEGWMMVGVGADQFALITEAASAFDSGLRVQLPADVRLLVIRADEVARQDLVSIAIRPVRIRRRSERVTRVMARRAVRYDTASVFFLDDRAYTEPSAFWVAGRREASIVIAPARTTAAQPLLLRNAPVDNTVTLISGSWRMQLTLSPGEERRVDVPMDPSCGAALLRIGSSAGFKPSEQDPSIRDGRYLGVYVRVGDR